jgi:hypothetical protein
VGSVTIPCAARTAPLAGGSRSRVPPKTAALGNARGEVRLHASLFAGVRRGVVIAESIWPNHCFDDGRGINTLTGADAIARL